jgi:hypothetical protein
MAKYMLTTVDNPYNPHEEFNDWYAYDTRTGYNSLEFLARIAKVSNDLSEKDYALAISNAVDEIVQENASGMHTKILIQDDST